MPTETRTAHTAGKLIRELLAVSPHPYPDSAAIERGRALKSLYYYADRDRALGSDLAALVRSSHWARLALTTWTKDEFGLKARTKPFPPLECYKILADWADELKPSGRWLRPVLNIDKSRQVMVSWWTMARLSWCAEWNQYAMLPVVSKNEDDSKEMIRRAAIMAEMLPDWYRRAAGLGNWIVAKVETIKYPNEATIKAIPQKGKQVAGLVPRMIFLDEFSKQSEAQDNYTVVGAFGDKCQIIIGQTPEGGTFADKLLHDQLDGAAGPRLEHRVFFPDTSPRPEICNEPGLELWVNGKNGVDCAGIYFWADPGKRTKEAWDIFARGKAMWQFLKEFLRRWTTRGGQPVFSMADAEVHMMAVQPRLMRMGDGQWYMQIPGEYVPGSNGKHPLWREVDLYRAMDHGYRRHGALWGALDKDNDLFIYRARVKELWGLRANAQAVHNLSGSEEYRMDLVDAIGHDRLEAEAGGALEQYLMYETPDGVRPFYRAGRPTKGAGSRKSGVDQIASMLLSTLAAEAGPEHAHFVAEKYTPEHVESLAECSRLYIAPEARALFEELVEARFDERPDPTLDAPETTLDAPDEDIDCLRYILNAIGPHRLRRRREGENEFKAVRAG